MILASTAVSSGAEQNPPEKADPETKPVASSNNAPKTHPPREFNTAVTGGRGLVRAASPYTLASGELVASAHVVNFDRNPGDIDFFDFPLGFTLGLPKRTEFFFSFSPTLRTNSVGQDPVGYPVPPLDLFVDVYPSDATRPAPYFMNDQEAPYKTYFVPNVTIDPPGHGAFASSTGDILLGGKIELASEERDDALGFGVRGYVAIPTEKPVYNTFVTEDEWHKYAGVSGETDVGLDLLFAKRFWITELLVNVGYKFVGDPDRGLRVQYVDSSGTSPEEFLVGEPVETKLNLYDQVFLTAGTSVPAFSAWGHQAWLLGEFTYTRYLGSGSVERLVHPVEARLVLQFDFPWYQDVAIGLGWQLLFNDAGDGDQRFSNLVSSQGFGDINFSELVDPALSEEVQSYMAERGATFSENSSRVFSTNNPAFDAWRNVPTGPMTVIGRGGGNWVAYVMWRVGDLW
jgi:hypothetical protein